MGIKKDSSYCHPCSKLIKQVNLNLKKGHIIKRDKFIKRQGCNNIVYKYIVVMFLNALSLFKNKL